MVEFVLIAVMVVVMVAAPPTFMFGLALREQKQRSGPASGS
jgi:hypothetical protein